MKIPTKDQRLFRLKKQGKKINKATLHLHFPNRNQTKCSWFEKDPTLKSKFRSAKVSLSTFNSFRRRVLGLMGKSLVCWMRKIQGCNTMTTTYWKRLRFWTRRRRDCWTRSSSSRRTLKDWRRNCSRGRRLHWIRRLRWKSCHVALHLNSMRISKWRMKSLVNSRSMGFQTLLPDPTIILPDRLLKSPLKPKFSGATLTRKGV